MIYQRKKNLKKNSDNFGTERRKCFLCKSKFGYQLFYRSWPVVGIGEVEFGIRICENCGAVFQDPVVPFSTMQKIYVHCSNYTNPGRGGCPSYSKIRGVNRHIEIIKNIITSPGRAFQIGCSDGYTLYRFRENGWEVSGLEPSYSASRLAKERYNIDPIIGFIEEYDTNEKYDLIILTHILEHLYNPLEILQKCRRFLKDDGIILIEVPLLDKPELWPPGYFSLEHVNYFSKKVLGNLLRKAGFDFISSPKIYLNEDIYPVITVVAKKEIKSNIICSDLDHTKETCYKYLQREIELWNKINHKLVSRISEADNVIIWGAGFHTSQLLTRTDMKRLGKVSAIVDSDSQKWGLFLDNYKVISCHDVDFSTKNLVIVISSYASEKEIYNSLISRQDFQARIVCLYN